MEKSSLNKLQSQVSNLGGSNSKLETLTDAFQLFTTEAKRLEEEYKKLKSRFTQVNLELEKTNRELKNKVLQLNYITTYLNNILSNIHQGLLFLDLSGTIITVNSAAENILGKSIDTLKYQNYQQTLGEFVFGFSLEEHLKEKKEIHTHRFTYQLDNSCQKELEISTSFVEKGPPSQHGLIILIKDISELCHLQLINNRNDRLKDLGEMAARVAHEIRNPLGGIEGFANLLSRDLASQPNAKNMAEHILSGAKIIGRLVSRILDYSRPMQPNLRPIDLNQLLEKALEMLKVDKRFNKQHHLKFKPLGSITSIRLDEQLMLSALWNLLINASEAMDGCGEITIKLDQNKSNIFISIQDQGRGIPEHQVEKIFSPLYTSKQKGNGLGLSEVYKIIQLHGGDITVDSTLDEGTTFTLTFPLQNHITQGSPS